MPNPDAETAEPADGEPADDAAEATEAVGQAEAASDDGEPAADDTEALTDDTEAATDDTEAATKVFSTEETAPERRFTAPGFDAGPTEIIQSVPEPATEVLHTQHAQKGLSTSRGWGWGLALILVVLALLAIVVLGSVWLTRHRGPKVSQEDLVRNTIENFGIAVQNGDLATLRTITCGTFRDRYVNYNERAWDDTYQRVAAAKQYPVVASIDEVVVNGDHAEANVTAYMAFAPEMRSPRSFDLQFRDDQWKICQSPSG
jgi:hypothetical protein